MINATVISYLQGCATGSIRFQDCGPVWQMGVIAGLIVLAIIALVAMRLSGRANSAGTTNG